MNTPIALVDDHILVRKGMAELLEKFHYTVAFEADNGRDFLEKINLHTIPEIVLMDINMPEMDGYETTLWLKKNHPEIKVLALSMFDDEASILKMIRSGARGYILKDCHPSEFKEALQSLVTKGFYQSEFVTGKLIRSINQMDEAGPNSLKDLFSLTDNEIEFLKLACTELTYKEIADKMCLSPRTIDGYRDDLFEKLEVKSRVGLVLFAIKNGIAKI